ncbi:MAG: hypothetical protein FWE37_02260 [Spirochaetaceae bacterium]|nr:hypothetical protein [Spirochaetaceae bacterium]
MKEITPEYEQELNEVGLTKEDLELKDWDIAEILDTKEQALAHIDVALEDNDIAFLYDVLEALPRSKAAKYFGLDNNTQLTIPFILQLFNNLGLGLAPKSKSLQMA